MNNMDVLGSIFTFFIVIQAVKANAPRGVPLSQSVLYNPTVDFTCLDGLKTIPFSYVNDDYCDCQDASDEPGTSACPNGFYYCTNTGFKPRILPSSRVNDGICDCCDGSDEWNNQSACHNNCKEMFQLAHAELIKQAEEANQGFEVRQEYAATGQQVKNDNKARLGQLKKSLEIISKQVEDVFFQKSEAEHAETDAKSKEKAEWEEFKAKVAAREDLKDAVAAFVSLDVDRDAMVTVNEILPHTELSPDGLEFTEEKAKLVLLERDSVEVDGFLEIIWPMISSKFIFIEEPNVVEPQETKESPEIFDIEAEYPELDEDDEEDDEDYEEEDGLDDPEEDEDEEGYWDESGKHTVPTHEDEKPQEETPQEDGQDEQQTQEETESEVPERSVDLPNDPPYNPVTRILIQAADDLRKKHTEATDEKKRIEREISNIEDSLEFDFGSDEAFYSLKGNCYELRTLEYIYKLCPFDKSVQVPIKGGSETSLGKWDGWSGPDDDKYSEMKYTRGLKCWNGPDRSTTVVVKCGSENKVLSASEPSRCEYKFEFTTPAICKKIFVPQSHDEL